MNNNILVELEGIRANAGGILHARDILDRARDKSNPLHILFEWDDSAAAEAYRLHQAHRIIRASVTIIPNGDGQAVRVRTYISLSSDRTSGAGYRAMVDVIDDQAAAIEALRTLRNEIKALQAKYSAFALLMPAFAAMVDVLPDEAIMLGDVSSPNLAA